PLHPVRVGGRVRCHRLSSILAPPDTPERYISKRPEVVGEVIAIRGMEQDTTEFVVRNQNTSTTTKFAYLTVPHVPGVTVQLTWLQRAVRFLLTRFLPRIKWIAIRSKAAIVNETGGHMDLATGDEMHDIYEA
ncbi:hypothetical protein C2E23DRAFT_727540, partial [Lenzites betulinus]